MLKYAPVLVAINSGSTSDAAVAKRCKISVGQARGALRSLRAAGFVSGDNAEAAVTKAGNDALTLATKGAETEPTTPTGRAHKRTTKMAKAITLFQRHIGQGRQAVLEKFQSKLDMTAGGASTYFQNIRKELGASQSVSA